MNDQNESSKRFDPENWEQFAVFRESFLSIHLSHEDADAFRRVGRFLYLMTLSGDDLAPEAKDSSNRSCLRGVSRDLRWMQGFLLDLGRRRLGCELEEGEEILSGKATELANELEKLAEEIEGLASRAVCQAF